ncbi:chondroitin sulfate synthase 1 [Anthonomus grandis grandis]|uniref:chondroitin sulfate synthase 1 n=1 Tax=Anthonomus grandis grandis TaxID=2921223 RepID=UPI002165EBE7|nr:chondroitin sulfate synthase 1 [Anthonomus grandis grandis]XP_050293933.1 chondroitin sulfate synthase 1 [Anthonomus grandis grandis]
MKMAKPKKVLKILLGIIIGVLCSQLFANTEHFCAPHFVVKSEKLVDDVDLVAGKSTPRSKNLLFVGVMTAEQFLPTRAKAVWNTWGQEVPGKMLIFSSENSTYDGIPLVSLPGIDDSYPPQKKSFTMLKYMHDNFIDQYEWFMRADDDVYVKSDKMEEFLRAIDSRKPLFIGQTGRGKKEEKGHLSLDTDENFCMGGPGMIMSRETLKRIAPYIEDCLVNLYTNHEDVEIGRCVRKFAGVSCTWNYEMQVIFHHTKNAEELYSGNLNRKEVHKAINLHPVKNHEHLYKLHTFIQGVKVQQALQKSVLLHRDIASSMKELGYRIQSVDSAHLGKDVLLFPVKQGQDQYLGDTSLLGVPVSINRYVPKNTSDVLEWELVSKVLYSYKDLQPKRRIGTSLKEGLDDVTREIMELINQYSKQRGRIIDFKEILYGYWRLNPLYGVDLILDLLLTYKKYRGHKMTVQVRRHAYVQQTFTGTFIREALPESPSNDNTIINKVFNHISNNLPPLLSFSSETSSEPLIHLLLPLSGRYETFVRFLHMYEEICIQNWEKTHLIIILFHTKDQPEEFNNTVKLVESVNDKIKNGFSGAYKNHQIIDVIEFGLNSSFARGVALQRAVDTLQDSDLMLFIDVDIAYDRTFLQRVRKNTVLGKSVYFPILYSLFNPKLLGKDISVIANNVPFFTTNNTDTNSGYWRSSGFGMASMYKKDYLALGGFDTNIQGWGKEDVMFFEEIVHRHTHKLVRCVDPGLVHIFHEVKCDASLAADQKIMCLGTQANTLGSLATVQKMYERYIKGKLR